MKRVLSLLIIAAFVIIPVLGFATGSGETKATPTKLKVLVLYWDENRRVMHKDYYLQNVKKDLPNYDVEFELGASDSGTYLAKLRTYLSAGDMPDVFFSVGTSSVSPLLKAKALLPFEKYLYDDGFAKRFKNIEKYKAPDGHIYALEAGWDFYFGTVIYYNIDLFDKAGISVPKSWDEFVAACTKLLAQGITPFAVPAKEYWGNTHLWDMAVYAEDPKAVENLVNRKVKITDPVFLNAAKRIRQLYEAKAFQEGATNYNWADTDAYFRAQKAAMLLIQTWSLFTYVSGADPIKFNFSYMTIPPAKPNLDLSRTYPLHYDPLLGFSISATTKHPKEAVKLLEWLIEQDAKWGLEKAKMPVALDVGIKMEGMHPLAVKWVNDISSADYIYSEFGNHFDSETINEFTILVQKLINGDILPEAFIQEAAKTFEKYDKK